MKSIRQMIRTPWKTSLFFLMMVLSVALFIVGQNLWLNASVNLQRIDEAFTTIGTVRQKQNTMKTEETWDAGLNKNVYRSKPVYDSYIPLSALQLEGAEYMAEPEQRPFYGAYVSELRTHEDFPIQTTPVIEFTPVEDGAPTGPVEVEVVRVLFGTGFAGEDLTGERIQFCDHLTQHPDALERGKTYIAHVFTYFGSMANHESLGRGEIEYVPYAIYAQQPRAWEEVTEGFYETAPGMRWLNYVDAIDVFYDHTVPVTPTKDTKLLTAFHEGKAAVIEGRDIQAEEYRTGDKVCLISQRFADLNALKPGDTLKLGLYNANYQYTAVQVYGYGAYLVTGELKADGSPFDIFEESSYTIVGVYAHPNVSGLPTGYELSPNEVIVPMKSIQNSDQNHIVATGPMQGQNTSFRIPNGTGEAYMEELSRIPESSLLEVRFYDGGYEKFAAGLRSTRLIAAVLLCAGLALVVAVVSLVLYFFILKQRKRTAIERAMGMTRRQCMASLMIGILLLTTLGSVAGCVLGTTISDEVQSRVGVHENAFDTTYTKGVLADKPGTGETQVELQAATPVMPCLLTIGGIAALVFALSLFMIDGSLRIAPIGLLSAKNDE